MRKRARRDDDDAAAAAAPSTKKLSFDVTEARVVGVADADVDRTPGECPLPCGGCGLRCIARYYACGACGANHGNNDDAFVLCPTCFGAHVSTTERAREKAAAGKKERMPQTHREGDAGPVPVEESEEEEDGFRGPDDAAAADDDGGRSRSVSVHEHPPGAFVRKCDSDRELLREMHLEKVAREAEDDAAAAAAAAAAETNRRGGVETDRRGVETGAFQLHPAEDDAEKKRAATATATATAKVWDYVSEII